MPTPIIHSQPINVTAGNIIDPTGELARYGEQGANIPSNNNIDLANATGFYVNITGTTNIISLGVADPGIIRFLTFTGTLTLIHNAVSLILPGATNITTAAGDCALFISLGSGNWKCAGYLRASGKPISITKTDIGLSNVENTALSTWPGSTNITTVGTITTGVWHGSAVGAVYGGTGLTSFAQGDVAYADGVNTLAKLPKNTTATRYFANTGTNNNPAWSQVNLTDGVTGVLPDANGGHGRGVQSATSPTGTTATVNLALGNVIFINLANATGTVSLALQNPSVGILYCMIVTQGATKRDITFPSGTVQALQLNNSWGSSGSSLVDCINFIFDSAKYRILGTTPDMNG